MTHSNSNARRQLLAQLVRFLFFIGLLAFSWVIITSLTFTQPDVVKSASNGLEVDVSQLLPGQLMKVTLRHREIWIYHRDLQDIEYLKQRHSDLRSQREAYFVFYPYEPKRQCVVNWDETNRSLYDTCNARYFDLAGRLVSEAASMLTLLSVPEYHFVSEHVIQIDAR